MATQGERRALMFLAAVALLGAGVRAWRAKNTTVDNAGLAMQIEAVDRASDRASVPGARGRGRGRSAAAVRSATTPSGPVDLDTAPAEEIEALPGIGPALARRIVEDRRGKGPFGCLAALDDVKGIGPSMLSRLDSLATFSGAGRPACVRSGLSPSGR